MPQTNRHPVDELAEIRAKKKALDAREAELKELIFDMAGNDRHAVGGDEFICQIREVPATRLDRKAVDIVLGEDIERCLKTSTTLRFDVAARVADAA